MPTSPVTIYKPNTRPYSIRRLGRKSLDDLTALHTAVYGKDTVDFRKKYDTAYTGAEFVGFIAYNNDGLPIAYYGVIPCMMAYGATEMLAAQSADTMTHPAHRHKGMFAELSRMTFDLCKEIGIRLIYGFPNQNSYHTAVTLLNWKEAGQMEGFTIPVRTLPLASLSKKIGLYNNFYRWYGNLVLGRSHILPPGVANSVLQDGFAGVQRTNAYLNYKTYNPSRVMMVEGAKLWITHKHGLTIGDAEGIDEGNFKQVIGRLKKTAAALGIRQIQFHTSTGTRLHQLFAAYYPSFQSFPVLFQDFGSPIPPEKIKFTFADIDIF